MTEMQMLDMMVLGSLAGAIGYACGWLLGVPVLEKICAGVVTLCFVGVTGYGVTLFFVYAAL
jgi:hypothetical protein